MTSINSYRQILRSSSIIGAATAVNILIGLLRTKIAAMILGPAGVGLIGLYTQLITTSANVSSLGFGSVGTRQIAEAQAQDNPLAVAAARRALFLGTLALAALGTAVVWALRTPIASYVLNDPSQANSVGWLALGVGLTVAAGSQTAVLTGLRRIGDFARLTVVAAALSTAVGIAALSAWGGRGILVFVLAAPLAMLTLGSLYVARTPKVEAPPTPSSHLVAQWLTLARLGIAFMGASLVLSGGLLSVQSLLLRELGSNSLGQFQAAWTLSMTYIGFVLAAMATDYYPRLSASIHDRAAASRMVNDQTEVALLLAGPLLLAMLALAPWIVRLLYTPDFAEAAAILRWQVLGDVLKLASWPLGFVLVAAGAGRAYLLSESVAIGLFVLLVWLGLPLAGVQITGVAFAIMYAVYLPLVRWMAHRRIGFVWRTEVRQRLTLLSLTALATCLLAHVHEWLTVAVGLAAAGAFGLHGFHSLARMLTSKRD